MWTSHRCRSARRARTSSERYARPPGSASLRGPTPGPVTTSRSPMRVSGSAPPGSPAGGVPVPPIVEPGVVAEEMVGRPHHHVGGSGVDELLAARAAIRLAARSRTAAGGRPHPPDPSVATGLLASPAVGDGTDVERDVTRGVVTLAGSTGHPTRIGRPTPPPRSPGRRPTVRPPG